MKIKIDRHLEVPAFKDQDGNRCVVMLPDFNNYKHLIRLNKKGLSYLGYSDKIYPTAFYFKQYRVFYIINQKIVEVKDFETFLKKFDLFYNLNNL